MNLREAVRAALRLLDRRDQRLLVLATMIQIAVSLLDLLGIALLGGVGTLALSALQSQPPPNLVENVVTALGLGTLSDMTLVATLSIVAAALLIAKSATCLT